MNSSLLLLVFSHEELLVRGGLYAAMWTKQQKSLDSPTETQTDAVSPDA